MGGFGGLWIPCALYFQLELQHVVRGGVGKWAALFHWVLASWRTVFFFGGVGKTGRGGDGEGRRGGRGGEGEGEERGKGRRGERGGEGEGEERGKGR